MKTIDRDAPEVEFSEIHWRYKAAGELGKDIPVLTASNHKIADNNDDPIFIIPGYGERKGSLEQCLTTLGQAGVSAIAMVAPLELVPPTPEAIERVCIETPQVVIDDLCSRFATTLPKPRAITNSQGSGVLSKAMYSNPELIGDVVFMEPMSSNSSYLTERYPNKNKRLRAYLARYLQTLVTQDMLDTQQPLAGLEILKRVIPDIMTGHLAAGINSSIDHDLVPIAISHARGGNRVALTLGTNDSLFPAHEVVECVDKELGLTGPQETPDNRPKFLIDNARHVALRTKKGKKRLLEAAEWLNTQ